MFEFMESKYVLVGDDDKDEGRCETGTCGSEEEEEY